MKKSVCEITPSLIELQKRELNRQNGYLKLAKLAEKLKFEEASQQLKGIAEDEERHGRILEEIIMDLKKNQQTDSEFAEKES